MEGDRESRWRGRMEGYGRPKGGGNGDGPEIYRESQLLTPQLEHPQPLQSPEQLQLEHVQGAIFILLVGCPVVDSIDEERFQVYVRDEG